MYLFAHWLAFISLFKLINLNQTNSKKHLFLFSIASVLGFITIPSFLYFYLTAVLFFLIFAKTSKAAFLKYQLCVCIIVALFYLPAICFSGVDALINNHYVRPETFSRSIFLSRLWMVCGYYLGIIYSTLIFNSQWLNYFLFLLPGCLIFFKNKSAKFNGIFYFFMWIILLLFIVCMNKYPYTRNLTGYFSIGLAILLLTFFNVLNKLPLKNKLLKQTIYSVILISSAVFMFINSFKLFNTELYGYSLKDVYNEVTTRAKTIPPNATIAFSDETFYWYYRCRSLNYKL